MTTDTVDVEKYLKLRRTALALDDFNKQLLSEHKRLRNCVETIAGGDLSHSGQLAKATLELIKSERLKTQEEKSKRTPELTHAVSKEELKDKVLVKVNLEPEKPAPTEIWNVSVKLEGTNVNL